MANIDKHLQALAGVHKLHVDQWETLENEVKLTMLGIEQVEALEKNIIEQVEVTPEVAAALARSINAEIFEPVRQELERQLEHPDAAAEKLSGVETARNQMLSENAAASAADANQASAAPSTPVPVIGPATPPQVQTGAQVTAPPAPADYVAGAPSTTRKAVENDPYREPIT